MNIFYNGELFYFKYCNKTIYIQHKIISVSFDILYQKSIREYHLKLYNYLSFARIIVSISINKFT